MCIDIHTSVIPQAQVKHLRLVCLGAAPRYVNRLWRTWMQAQGAALERSED